jgi:hypothetical protein
VVFCPSEVVLLFVASLLADVFAATDTDSRRRIPMQMSSNGAVRKKSEDVADVSNVSNVS